MFIINRKSIPIIPLIIYCTFIVQLIKPQQELNYESLYRLHLKWNIEDLEAKRIKLKNDIYKIQEKKEEVLRKKNTILSEIERLKNEKNLSYHMNSYFTQIFQGPRPYRRKNPVAGLIWELKEWGRFLSAYLLLPISVPLTAINAGQKWISKKDNDDQIAALEKSLEEYDNVLSKISSEIETEAARIEPEIAQIDTKIAKLETEKKELLHLDNFKATYKPRYIPK